MLKKYAKEENNISLKEINKKNILKIVIEMGPISRIGISKQLKISRPTTSAYMSELIKDGLIEEIAKTALYSIVINPTLPLFLLLFSCQLKFQENICFRNNFYFLFLILQLFLTRKWCFKGVSV
ncbi:hypothetical protein ES708_15855 [subsurface metagenome]